MLRIIRTKYLGPTHFKGTRIVATDLRTGTRIIEGYDYAAHDPHAIVADKLITKLKGDGNVPVQSLGTNEDSTTHEQYHVYTY